MLNSLRIRNYRNLKDFELKNLDQVNLITGRNNTGKSTILEAIAIFAFKADINLIFQLLEKRGENYELSTKLNITEANLNSIASLFTDRKVGYSEEDLLYIGSDQGNEAILRFIRMVDKTIKTENGEVLVYKTGVSEEDLKQSNSGNYETGLQFKMNALSAYVPINKIREADLSVFSSLKDNLQYINTSLADRDTNAKLFDNIALSEKEAYVVEALKIIEPSTERIAFIEERPGERKAVIKLSGHRQTLPLRSMGDGINRILTIILALVNANDGYLLIDEFENGLHYNVQEKIWKIIFKLAKELNIQVFATTHSNDCIFGFEKALNDSENTTTGKLIRLDNENKKINCCLMQFPY